MGRFASGSPIMFLMIRYLSGSSPITGLTFSATGLYFFLAFFFAGLLGVTAGLPVLEGSVSEGGTEDARDATLGIRD
jgi:hypothetical protein